MHEAAANPATAAGTLAGKIAIVTGGGRDIGRACALRAAWPFLIRPANC